MFSGIITATVAIGCVGLFVGLFLGIAAIKFHVEVNPKEEEVLNALPGNNCGGCGYAGCSGLAAAIAKGEAAVNACPVGGDAVGEKIAISGRIQSREYQKKVADDEIKTLTAYEVSISKLAAYENAENFDLDEEFEMLGLMGQRENQQSAYND